MSPEEVITVGQKALELTALLCAPPLLGALIVGVVVGVFQAATQINEMTLSFVPKLAALGIITLLFGPWLLQTLIDFTITLFSSLGKVVE